jgi:hypothetical protein
MNDLLAGNIGAVKQEPHPALDQLLAESDNLHSELITLRRALRQSNEQNDSLHRQLNRLKRVLGKPDILFTEDICKGAGVKLNTLETWIHRKRGFPAPLPGTRPREWDKGEVLRWLEATGRVWVESEGPGD